MPSTLDPKPLMALATGLWATKALAVAQELDLFSLLAGDAGLTPAEVAQARGLELRPAELVLSACASLGLLLVRDGRFVDAPIAQEYLVPGRKYYFGDLVSMFDRQDYPAWMRLSEAVRHNRPAVWEAGERTTLFDPEDVVMAETFWGGMYSMSAYTAHQLGEVYDLSGVRRLMDVGGGGGAYTIELCRRHPHLQATVLDLPFVCDLTRPVIAAAGLDDRITCTPGDFFADERLPEGHDAILLSRVLHDWNEEEDRQILRKCVAAVDAGGVVLISEHLINEDGSGPAPAALMGLALLVWTTGGRTYTRTQYMRWLRDAGCAEATVVPFDGLAANAVVVGRKANR